MTYTWDANKNKTSESITGVMSGYGFTAAGTTYDFEDRLTGFSRAATSGPALLSQSWNLTTVGDWTSVTTNGTAQNRTHGPTHELLTAGGQNVATDVKGNITTLPANLRPAGATTALNLTWDSDNKLRSADIDANGTADVNFQYDALGRRVARTGTGGSVVFVQMDQQTIADYPVGGAATTPTFRYVYASYIDEPVVRKGPTSTSTAHFYHRNHQYSVTAITTSTGTIAERYAYTAYGQPTILNASGTPLSPQTSTLNSRYSYTGREWDATLGLHHFRARWMSPSAGRFLGRDPIGFEGGIPNIYAITVNSVDPSGMACFLAYNGPVFDAGNSPYSIFHSQGRKFDLNPYVVVEYDPSSLWVYAWGESSLRSSTNGRSLMALVVRDTSAYCEEIGGKCRIRLGGAPRKAVSKSFGFLWKYHVSAFAELDWDDVTDDSATLRAFAGAGAMGTYSFGFGGGGSGGGSAGNGSFSFTADYSSTSSEDLRAGVVGRVTCYCARRPYDLGRSGADAKNEHDSEVEEAWGN
jgi:RHS repeat-associated protein